MTTLLRLITLAMDILGYVIPVLGKMLEKHRATEYLTTMLRVLQESERLLQVYRQAQADGRFTREEIEWVMRQLENLMAATREAVSAWKR